MHERETKFKWHDASYLVESQGLLASEFSNG